jgi:hypothetical protein
MFPAANALGAEVGDGQVAEGEVEGGEREVYAQGRVAVFAREFAHALGKGEGLFGSGGGVARLRGLEAAGGSGETRGWERSTWTWVTGAGECLWSPLLFPQTLLGADGGIGADLSGSLCCWERPGLEDLA